MVALPIDPYLPAILQAVEQNLCLVLKAQPGTGKTTRVPPALLSSTVCKDRPEIWVLEPRRLAAKMAAVRVAAEQGETVGQTVGYQFRFENVGSSRTRLRFLTEGMLLRHLLSQPDLPSVAAVVLDEFHERHLQGDVALACLRRLQKTSRPDLRIVVMSATLQTAALEAYLEAPARMEIEAPHYPLTLRYFSPPSELRLEQAILRAVKMALSDPAYPGGDSLIFLPGVADIRRAQEALGAFARENRLAIFPLHGELSKEEQELALGPCDRRKLILSTNIAESSLTIEGVRTVVDSGLHRQASVSSWSGMPSLHTRPISKASAIQRAGRASRTGPGLCVRVYSQGDYDHRTPHESPEIQRADLSQTLLELKSLGIRESRFEWFETPPGSSLQTARSLLYQLGATDSEEATSRLTEIGNRLAQLPTHPRVGRLLIEAQTRGCLNAATHFSALLSEGLLQGMDVLETGAKQPVPERVRKQLQNLFPKGPDSGSFSTVAANLGQCALAAFPDRVAKRRQGSGDDLVLSSGGSLKAGANGTGANGHADQGIFFLVLDARETKGWDQARSVVRATAAFPLEPEWLFGVTPSPLVEEKEALLWDTARKRVVCRNRLLYGQLVLEESETAPNDWPKVADFLLLSALGLRKETSTALSFYEWIEKLLPVCPKETLENLFAKQKLAQDYFGQEKIPSIFERLQAACYGKTSLEDLKSIEWEAALFPPERFGRSLPAQVDLPGGRKVKVQYSLDRPPWIESRLQDFFGMKQGPTLLDGKLSLTLHLLAPNYRAVQVTTDLAGFWKNTYPTVKKELSRNYPRHAWPEDPLTAQPPTYKPRR